MAEIAYIAYIAYNIVCTRSEEVGEREEAELSFTILGKRVLVIKRRVI